MRENKTGVRLPVSPKKQMAERQARESLAAVAQGWSAPQQSVEPEFSPTSDGRRNPRNAARRARRHARLGRLFSV